MLMKNYNYDVFVRVEGRVKIGKVKAEHWGEACERGKDLVCKTIFDPSDLDDILEISHPLTFEAEEE
jgi:hypothetical protein